ncbi:MAG: acyl-CoA thioesterase [Oligosphaeraceae bacterium]
MDATITYRVPYADTDQMGFVYYGNYLVFFERARNELMRTLGFTYRELEGLGVGLPVIEASLKYHVHAQYDDLLTIRARVAEYTGIRVKVECQVLRDDKLLVEGWTRHAFMDLKTGRPARVPAIMQEKLRQLTAEQES